MKITCPYTDCEQRISIEIAHADTEANCPGCGRPFQCPPLSAFSTLPPSASLQNKVSETSRTKPVKKASHSCPYCSGQIEVAGENDTAGAACPHCGRSIQFDPPKEVGKLKAMGIGMMHFGQGFVKIWFGALINIWPLIVGLELNGGNLDRVGEHALAGVAKTISGLALTPWAAVVFGVFLIIGIVSGLAVEREQQHQVK